MSVVAAYCLGLLACCFVGFGLLCLAIGAELLTENWLIKSERMLAGCVLFIGAALVLVGCYALHCIARGY